MLFYILQLVLKLFGSPVPSQQQVSGAEEQGPYR